MRVLRRVTSGFFKYALAISKARAVARPSGTTSVTAPHSLAVAAEMGLGSNNIASARVGPTRYDQAVKMPSPGTMPPAKCGASWKVAPLPATITLASRQYSVCTQALPSTAQIMGTRMLAMFSTIWVPSSCTFDQTSGSLTLPNDGKSMSPIHWPPVPVRTTILLFRSRPMSYGGVARTSGEHGGCGCGRNGGGAQGANKRGLNELHLSSL